MNIDSFKSRINLNALGSSISINWDYLVDQLELNHR